MDNVVTINHKKENVIEFDLTMDGVDREGAEVKLMVETKDMELGFKATHKTKDTWSVKLPKLSILERTAYNFYIEIHVDGYFFNAFKGTLNVVGSAEIYSSEPKNVTLKNDEGKADKKEKKAEKKSVSESWRQSEKSIEQIARELMEKRDLTKDTIDQKAEEVHEAADGAEHTDKDEKVRAILEESGIKTKRGKKPRISFIKTHTLN